MHLFISCSAIIIANFCSLFYDVCGVAIIMLRASIEHDKPNSMVPHHAQQEKQQQQPPQQ